jgi:hypothetical protein
MSRMKVEMNKTTFIYALLPGIVGEGVYVVAKCEAECGGWTRVVVRK